MYYVSGTVVKVSPKTCKTPALWRVNPKHCGTGIARVLSGSTRVEGPRAPLSQGKSGPRPLRGYVVSAHVTIRSDVVAKADAGSFFLS